MERWRKRRRRREGERGGGEGGEASTVERERRVTVWLGEEETRALLQKVAGGVSHAGQRCAADGVVGGVGGVDGERASASGCGGAWAGRGSGGGSGLVADGGVVHDDLSGGAGEGEEEKERGRD